MAEYIEKSVAEKIIRAGYAGTTTDEQLKRLQDAPAADVAPVVRCRDCKHWKKQNFHGGNDLEHMEFGGHCPIVRFARFESDFCSNGERKDGE